MSDKLPPNLEKAVEDFVELLKVFQKYGFTEIAAERNDEGAWHVVLNRESNEPDTIH